jgi:hypothetical protein
MDHEHDRLREEARQKLLLARNTIDAEAKQRLAESAFELAQRAEAIERAQEHGSRGPTRLKR